MKITTGTFLTRLMITDEGSITQLVSTDMNNVIKLASTGKDRATKGDSNSNGEVDNVDIIYTAYSRFVKFSSQF